MAKIAEKAAFSPLAESLEATRGSSYEGPERVLRTCLASMARSEKFGKQMEREARRRKFFAAPRRVFIGDGLPWNWSIWKELFPTFTPILDFIHAVQYLYSAAAAWESEGTRRWSRYLSLAEALWRGNVAEVVEQLHAELMARGVRPEDDLPENSPHQPLIDAARYLRNNQQRMD